jgi:hypothetical protein
VAHFQQAGGDMKADETGRSGDETTHDFFLSAPSAGWFQVSTATAGVNAAAALIFAVGDWTGAAAGAIAHALGATLGTLFPFCGLKSRVRYGSWRGA